VLAKSIAIAPLGDDAKIEELDIDGLILKVKVEQN
jgi:hypothetical protein